MDRKANPYTEACFISDGWQRHQHVSGCGWAVTILLAVAGLEVGLGDNANHLFQRVDENTSRGRSLA